MREFRCCLIMQFRYSKSGHYLNFAFFLGSRKKYRVNVAFSEKRGKDEGCVNPTRSDNAKCETCRHNWTDQDLFLSFGPFRLVRESQITRIEEIN